MSETTREQVRAELTKLAGRRGIRILWACEAGSRAWGIDSADSDYDVRFVYRYPAVNDYLSVYDAPRRGTRKGNDGDARYDTVNETRGLLDLSGWDIRKALRLFRKSNPSLLEWLVSPTVYVDTHGLRGTLTDLARKQASGAAAIYHYHHMAKSNFREYLLHERVKLKKYLYVVRPLLAMNWIADTGRMPAPIAMSDLIGHARETRPDDRDTIDAIEDLVRRKRGGEELQDGPRIDALNAFISQGLARVDEAMRQKGWMESYAKTKVETDTLDRMFQALLAQ